MKKNILCIVDKGGIVTLDKYSGNVDYRIVKH